METNPKLVGITGGIGSGKSTICKIFETLGHQVYYADDRAKWLMENDTELMNQINGLFGEKAYNGKTLDRKWIAKQVFKDQELLSQLNARVHPAVGRDLAIWKEANQGEKILFYEAALIFETGSNQKMDATILVTAPEELRISRVIQRDKHRTEVSVKEIISKQMKDEEKVKLADYVITNDGTSSIIKHVMEIYDELA